MQRDNWKKEQVLEFIAGQKFTRHSETPMAKAQNEAVAACEQAVEEKDKPEWTNQEVMDLLSSLKREGNPGLYTPDGLFNYGVDDVADVFVDFMRPTDESGAMAYNPEEKGVVHVGPMLWP